MQKLSARSIPIYNANFATFEESWNFRCTKRPFLTAVAAKHDMIWYEISRPSFFYPIAHLKMATSEPGGGLCISFIVAGSLNCLEPFLRHFFLEIFENCSTFKANNFFWKCYMTKVMSFSSPYPGQLKASD